MTRLLRGCLIALIFTSFNTCAQNLIDSTTVSKALLLLRDYKACQEINERLEHRLYIYEEKVKADSVTMDKADSVIMVQDTIITDLSNENYELEQDVTKLKNRRKFWFIGGLATGLSAFLLFVF